MHLTWANQYFEKYDTFLTRPRLSQYNIMRGGSMRRLQDGDVLQDSEAADHGIFLGPMGRGVMACNGATSLDELTSCVIRDDLLSGSNAIICSTVANQEESGT
jgi:hypothetical protein